MKGLAIVLGVMVLLVGCGRGSASLSNRAVTEDEPPYSNYGGSGGGNFNFDTTGTGSGGTGTGGSTSAGLTPADTSVLAQEVGATDAKALANLTPLLDSPDLSQAQQVPAQILRILARIQDPRVQAAFMELARSIPQDMATVPPNAPPSQWKLMLQKIKSKVMQFIRAAISYLTQKYASGK